MKSLFLAAVLTCLCGSTAAADHIEYEITVTQRQGDVVKTLHSMGLETALGSPYPFTVRDPVERESKPKKRSRDGDKEPRFADNTRFSGAVQPTFLGPGPNAVETVVAVTLFNQDGIKAEMTGGDPVDRATSSEALRASGIDAATISGGRRFVLQRYAPPRLIARGPDGIEITVAVR